MSLPIKHLALVLSLVAAAAAYAPSASAQPPAASPAPQAVPLSGKAVESMNSGGYTYVLLDNGGAKVWVAIPQTKVATGQQLTLIPGYEMKNFTSKGLKRTFDKVVFSAGLVNSQLQLSPAAMKVVHQGVPMTAPAPGAASAPAATKPAQPAQKTADAKQAQRVSLSLKKIEKAKGPNAYTIAQLYAKKSQLEKKPVVVRGRIVKISPRILKRNWIHIQDGSGSATKKTNDLIVTTKDLAKVGEIVTVKGTLYNNMDFGSGYRYGLLVEGARFSR